MASSLESYGFKIKIVPNPPTPYNQVIAEIDKTMRKLEAFWFSREGKSTKHLIQISALYTRFKMKLWKGNTEFLEELQKLAALNLTKLLQDPRKQPLEILLELRTQRSALGDGFENLVRIHQSMVKGEVGTIQPNSENKVPV